MEELKAINIIKATRRRELTRALEDITEVVWRKIEKFVKTDSSWMQSREESESQVAPLADAHPPILARGPVETRLCKAQKGRGPSPTGLAYEHLQLALRYATTWDSYVSFAEAMGDRERAGRY